VKHDFDETRMAEGRSSVDGPRYEFDWEALYQRLGEDVREGKVDHRLQQVVVRLLQLLVPPTTRHIQPESIGLRVIALAWVVNPAYFEGTPSMRELARRCGVNHCHLAHHTGHYSRLLGLRNRGQNHAWNWHDQAEETDGPEPPSEVTGYRSTL
jgi:hypothetical protein